MKNLDAEEFYNQSRTFIGTRDYESALEYIDKALELDNMCVEYYIQKGIVLANMSQFSKAIEEMRKALKIDKGCAEAYFHIGNFLVMLKDMKLGMENYNKAVSLGYTDSQIYFNMAMVYANEDKYDMAIRYLNKAISVDESRIDARIRKASAQVKIGKYADVLVTADEIISADPDLFEGYHYKAVGYAQMGKSDESLAVLDGALELFPNDARFMLDKVNVLVIQSKMDEASELIEKLLNMDSIDSFNKRTLYLHKTRMCAMNQDLEGAVSALQQAKSISKDLGDDYIDPDSTFMLATLAIQAKDYEKALEYSEELIKDGSEAYITPAYFYKPFAIMNLKGKEAAIPEFKESSSKLRALTMSKPQFLDGYYFRAMCLKELGEYDKALDLSEYLIKIDSKDSNFHYLKANILNEAGRTDEALAAKTIAENLTK